MGLEGYVEGGKSNAAGCEDFRDFRSGKLVRGFRGLLGAKGRGRLPGLSVTMLRLRREGKGDWSVHRVFASERVVRERGWRPILLCSIER